MESPRQESQEPQADASEELANLKIEDDGSYPYFMFDDGHDDILDGLSSPLEELPTLFTEESEDFPEHYDDYSNVECDEGDSSDNAASPTDSTRHIRKSAKKLCEIIMYGFQMAVTEDILKTGDIDLDRFKKTKHADKMTIELDKNKELWKGKNTTEAILLGEVSQMLQAIGKHNYTKIAKTYYRAQHQHTLNFVDQPFKVSVHIDHSKINEKWIPHLKNAIKSINMATPGLFLQETENKNESKIQIGVEHENKKKHDTIYPTKKAYTRNGGSFLNAEKNPTKIPFIHLGSEYNENRMKGTSIHELMHALSFHHEMERPDNDQYMEISEEAKKKMKKRTPFLTRFDPFSIMMYSLGIDLKKKEGDDIWNLKPLPERCQELSELNKVALNLIFKPCITDGYKPTLNNKTKMLYCGRAVMINHNQVGKATSDYNCGPDNWANCPACRVIIRTEDEHQNSFPIPQLETCLKLGKWQGLSGVFYCGKEDEAFNECTKYPKKDNICGPDNGIPCKDCGQMLYQNYLTEVWAKLI